jgi:hypothetical protein
MEDAPSRKGGTAFIADAMLGSLARKLRALGFDTTYYRSGDDVGLIELAAREDRVILTSDRSLAARSAKRRLKVILLTGGNDSARVRALARAARPAGITLVAGDPLCSICGGGLRRLSKKEVTGHVPASVEGRHRFFFKCPVCGQIYWRGSHWKKLRLLARQLGAK